MRTSTAPIVVSLSLVLFVTGQNAFAQSTTTRTIQYSIRFAPASSTSSIHWIMELTLTPDSTVGQVIAWQPVYLRILEKNTSGEITNIWIDESPEVQTSDGLWRITHADVSSPELYEFLNPPTVTGEAFAKTNNSDILAYSFEGAASLVENPPTSQSSATRLNYSLRAAPTNDPIDEGDDEPAGADEFNG